MYRVLRVGSQLATDKQITRYLSNLLVLIKKILAGISGHQDEKKYEKYEHAQVRACCSVAVQHPLHSLVPRPSAPCEYESVVL